MTYGINPPKQRKSCLSPTEHSCVSTELTLRQISKCNSPAPAMMCSPDSSMIHWTIGSDLAKRFRPKQTFDHYNSLSFTQPRAHTQTQYNTN